MEKGCARAHVQMHPTHDLWKAPCWLPPTQTPNFNTIGQAIPEMQKRGVHVRTCRDIPPMTCGKHIVHGPQPTHQIRTQSVKPFLRYRSAVCTCARADEGTLPMPFVKCIANGHPSTYQISTQSAEPLPSYSNISFLCHPSGGTRHVLLLQFTCNGTNLIHCLKDGATQQRRPLANRTHGSRDIRF